jgi:hypothetical protein
MSTPTMGPGTGTTPRSATRRLDAESGTAVRLRTRRLTVIATVSAHLIGAMVVVVLLVFVLPVPLDPEDSAAIVRHLRLTVRTAVH